MLRYLGPLARAFTAPLNCEEADMVDVDATLTENRPPEGE